jgi:Tripartite tricarboxylate transporter TctB family
MNSLSKYSNSFMTVLMLVIFTGMVLVASTYPPGARFMPFVIGFPAIALCLLQLFLDARERRLARQGAVVGAGPSEIEKAEAQVSRAAGRPIHFDVGEILLPASANIEPREQLRREAISWAYFIALIIGVILFGFHIAVPVFLLLFLRYRAETSWKVAIGGTLLASVVLFFAFEYVLRISLHPGFITDRIKDMLGGG